MDLLAKYDAPPRTEEIELAGGIALIPRRPRARQGLRQHHRPFDAGEIRQREAELPTSQWSIISLFRATSETLASPAADTAARLHTLEGYMDELRRRGYDAEPLLRFGFRTEIAAGVLPPVIQGLVGEGKEGEVARGWAEIANSVTPGLADAQDTSSRLDLFFHGLFMDHLARWTHGAPLHEILDGRPPPLAHFVEAAGQPPPPEADGFIWLVDRFISTYLAEWMDASLRLEWAYIHSQTEAPCPPADMRARHVDQGELSKEMADRYAARPGRTAFRGTSPATKLVETAVGYLKEGRRPEATALFEAATRLNPTDPAAKNNYGFCILPYDPSAALLALEEASQLGYCDTTVNVSNRVLALSALGRITTALDLAESYLEESSHGRGDPAWLWDPSTLETSPTIVHTSNVRDYLIALTVAIAESSADDATVAKWHALSLKFQQQGEV